MFHPIEKLCACSADRLRLLRAQNPCYNVFHPVLVFGRVEQSFISILCSTYIQYNVTEAKLDFFKKWHLNGISYFILMWNYWCFPWIFSERVLFVVSWLSEFHCVVPHKKRFNLFTVFWFSLSIMGHILVGGGEKWLSPDRFLSYEEFIISSS